MFFVVKAGPKYELLATNSIGKALMATPALSDGMLILRAENNIYAIAADTADSRRSFHRNAGNNNADDGAF